jgi:hypothetical protein
METSAQRAASIQQVMQVTGDQTPEVKKAALEALGPVPNPSHSAADILWIILVSGLVVILVLTILGLTHVIGNNVTDDKIVTIFTTVLAGLLGLFVKSPTTT